MPPFHNKAVLLLQQRNAGSDKNHIAFFRYINPEANIRLAAGRALLTNDGETAFKSGASATITGNMLTTVACATIRSDRKMLSDMGRNVTPEYWKEVEES